MPRRKSEHSWRPVILKAERKVLVLNVLAPSPLIGIVTLEANIRVEGDSDDLDRHLLSHGYSCDYLAPVNHPISDMRRLCDVPKLDQELRHLITTYRPDLLTTTISGWGASTPPTAAAMQGLLSSMPSSYFQVSRGMLLGTLKNPRKAALSEIKEYADLYIHSDSGWRRELNLRPYHRMAGKLKHEVDTALIAAFALRHSVRDTHHLPIPAPTVKEAAILIGKTL